MEKPVKLLFFLTVFLPILSSCSTAPSANQSASSAEYLSYDSLSVSSRSEMFPEERMVTYTVTIRLAVKNAEKVKDMLLVQIGEDKGYIVRESNTFVTARIPSGNMDSFTVYAKTLGETEGESRTGTDITDQYRDNVIRLESLKNIRTRYMTLLDRANTVSDILSIERELERVNTEIEILEGRIRYSVLSVEYSNVTVHFREKAKPGPVGWIFYGLFRGVKWLFVWN